MNKLVLLALPVTLLLLSIEQSHSYLHTQNVFCDDQVDFVISARVKKNKPTDEPIEQSNEVVYKIKIKKVFKSSPAFEALPNTRSREENKLYSLTPGGVADSCTVQLTRRYKYLITGRVVDAKLYISQCTDWIQQWSTLFRIEKRNLKRNKYSPNCACTVEQISGPPPENPPPPTACLIVSSECGRHTHCQCTDVTCNSCSLAPSAEYQFCLEKSEIPA